MYSEAFLNMCIWKLSNQQLAEQTTIVALEFYMVFCFMYENSPMHKHENTGQLGFPASTTWISKVSAEIKLAYVSFKVLPLLCCGMAANEQIF